MTSTLSTWIGWVSSSYLTYVMTAQGTRVRHTAYVDRYVYVGRVRRADYSGRYVPVPCLAEGQRKEYTRNVFVYINIDMDMDPCGHMRPD